MKNRLSKSLSPASYLTAFSCCTRSPWQQQTKITKTLVVDTISCSTRAYRASQQLSICVLLCPWSSLFIKHPLTASEWLNTPGTGSISSSRLNREKMSRIVSVGTQRHPSHSITLTMYLFFRVQQWASVFSVELRDLSTKYSGSLLLQKVKKSWAEVWEWGVFECLLWFCVWCLLFGGIPQRVNELSICPYSPLSGWEELSKGWHWSYPPSSSATASRLSSSSLTLIGSCTQTKPHAKDPPASILRPRLVPPVCLVYDFVVSLHSTNFTVPLFTGVLQYT